MIEAGRSSTSAEKTMLHQQWRRIIDKYKFSEGQTQKMREINRKVFKKLDIKLEGDIYTRTFYDRLILSRVRF
ncbi:hypothetical protein EON65_41030 [archaeon]|nr:MAG: hypothetical protein EON65_41030 [archaeon]